MPRSLDTKTEQEEHIRMNYGMFLARNRFTGDPVIILAENLQCAQLKAREYFEIDPESVRRAIPTKDKCVFL